MRPRVLDVPAPHGALGIGIALIVFGATGLLVLVAAVLAGWFPEWLSGGAAGGDALLRWLVGLLGVALLAVAVGFLRFRSWAWWGGLAWSVWSVIEVARSLDPAGLVSGIPLPQLLAACALPYLWTRRRDFGVRTGRARRAARRTSPTASR